MEYSLAYINYISFLIFLMFFEFHCLNINKGEKLIRQIAIVSFTLFFGLRYYNGFDVALYLNDFENAPTLFNCWTQSFPLNYEIGWTLYTIICKTIFVKFEIFTFINTLIDAILLNNFLKKNTKYYIFGLIIFIAYNGLTLEVEQLRNAKAILIFANSLKYLDKNNSLKYICLNLLGASFHISALIYIICLPFFKSKTSKLTDLLCFIIPLLFFLFRLHWLEGIMSIISHILQFRISEKMNLYLVDTYISGGKMGWSFTMLEAIAIYILFIFIFDKKLQNKFSSYTIQKNILIAYFVSYLMFYEISVIAIRISSLFLVILPIVFSEYLEYFDKKIYKFVFVLIVCTFAFRKVYTNTNNTVYFYETIINHKRTIPERLEIINSEQLEKNKNYNSNDND